MFYFVLVVCCVVIACLEVIGWVVATALLSNMFVKESAYDPVENAKLVVIVLISLAIALPVLAAIMCIASWNMAKLRFGYPKLPAT